MTPTPPTQSHRSPASDALEHDNVHSSSSNPHAVPPLVQDKMPTESPFQIDIPSTNLLTYLFPSEDSVSNKPIWIDADDVQHALSPRQLLHWVKRLGAGLQGLGLKEQDVVMVYSLNHIFVPVAYLGVAGAGYVFSGCNPAYGVYGMFNLISLERNDMRCYEIDMKGMNDVKLMGDQRRHIRLRILVARLYWSSRDSFPYCSKQLLKRSFPRSGFLFFRIGRRGLLMV
jgi:hypothetical protein